MRNVVFLLTPTFFLEWIPGNLGTGSQWCWLQCYVECVSLMVSVWYKRFIFCAPDEKFDKHISDHWCHSTLIINIYSLWRLLYSTLYPPLSFQDSKLLLPGKCYHNLGRGFASRTIFKDWIFFHEIWLEVRSLYLESFQVFSQVFE